MTGAARGLGQAYCEALSAHGLHIAAVDRDPAEETLGRCTAPARGFVADLTDPSDVERCVAEVARAFGRIDVLVNNLGGFPKIPFLEMRLEDWRRILALNLDSCFYCCRSVLPIMVGQGHGRIINIASGTVFKGNTGMSAYIAAKSGVIGLTRVLATEFGPSGITVNCVAPGITDTPGAREYTDGMKSEDRTIAQRCIKRRELPSDVTAAICFFASEEARFVTGQTLVVDGGAVKN